MSSAYAKLLAVQKVLKAPKNQFNSFGKYAYRSCEDILQAARPHCNENGCVLTLKDEIEALNGRFYVKAIATITDAETGDSVSAQAYAREDEIKKGMDGAQITGTSSSYARKYALCALFAIDDNKDPDTNEFATESKKKAEEEHKEIRAEAKRTNPNPLSEVQRKALFAKLREIEPDKGKQYDVCARLIGHGFTSSSELTVEDFRRFMSEADRPADSPF